MSLFMDWAISNGLAVDMDDGNGPAFFAIDSEWAETKLRAAFAQGILTEKKGNHCRLSDEILDELAEDLNACWNDGLDGDWEWGQQTGVYAMRDAVKAWLEANRI